MTQCDNCTMERENTRLRRALLAAIVREDALKATVRQGWFQQKRKRRAALARAAKERTC